MCRYEDMLIAGIVLFLVLVSGGAVLWRAVKSAPEGHEDAEGFHCDEASPTEVRKNRRSTAKAETAGRTLHSAV